MKALILVLIIASIVFQLARPIAFKYVQPRDFARRRNIWFGMTIVGFLSPNFWLFAAVAIPVYIWIGRRDPNPTAAYLLLLHVMPVVATPVPTLGVVNELFGIDNYRLLSLCILVPVALRARKSTQHNSVGRGTDLLLLGYGLLQAALFIPPDLPNHVVLHDSATNVVRRIFLTFIDIFAPYYAISRSCSDRSKIIEAQASFCLAAAIMASVAVVEHLKGWLLYVDLAREWNPEDANYVIAWLTRGDSLRAQASSGHPLALGVLLAIAFGFWLFLCSRQQKWGVRLAIGGLLWAGLVASLSRGPWIGAVLIYLAYAALKPRAISRLFKASFLLIAALGILSLSPAGDKMLASLPLSGKSAQADSSVSYRQRLFDRSLELIDESPILGDQLALQKMEDMRQGQGIIDIVNAYLGAALNYGLLGLALFTGFILSAALRLYRRSKDALAVDPELAYLGFNVIACIVGHLFMIADCSMVFGVEKMFYILGALAVAVARLPAHLAPAQSPAPTPGKSFGKRFAIGLQSAPLMGRRIIDN